MKCIQDMLHTACMILSLSCTYLKHGRIEVNILELLFRMTLETDKPMNVPVGVLTGVCQLHAGAFVVLTVC